MTFDILIWNYVKYSSAILIFFNILVREITLLEILLTTELPNFFPTQKQLVMDNYLCTSEVVNHYYDDSYESWMDFPLKITPQW